MVELIRLAIAKPGSAVTVVLVMSVIALGSTTATTTTALAVINKEQRISEAHQLHARKQREMLIRMDQNLIDLKTHFLPKEKHNGN